jgi:hypothetical protein
VTERHQDAERDPVVRRAIDELQRVPQADAAAIRRVVAAAAAARLTPSDDEPMVSQPRRVSMRAWTIAGIAAAAAFVGFGVSNMRQREPDVTVASAPVSNLPSSLTAVANDAADVRAIPQQFVFHTGKARSVSLVGDFNKWDPSKNAMSREAGSDLWSITLPVIPGRHIYGYMVDDSIFVLDPRAPKARDRDLGVDGSVIIVGKP